MTLSRVDAETSLLLSVTSSDAQMKIEKSVEGYRDSFYFTTVRSRLATPCCILYDNTNWRWRRFWAIERGAKTQRTAESLLVEKFGRPGKGNNKGKVEGLVTYAVQLSGSRATLCELAGVECHCCTIGCIHRSVIGSWSWTEALSSERAEDIRIMRRNLEIDNAGNKIIDVFCLTAIGGGFNLDRTLDQQPSRMQSVLPPSRSQPACRLELSDRKAHPC